jgi:hypothetical protein
MSNAQSFEFLKSHIVNDVRALLRLQSAGKPSAGADVLPPSRTGNLNDPLEADLYSILEQGGLELVQLAVAEAVDRNGKLRPAQALAILEEICSFLSMLWLNTGTPSQTLLLGAVLGRSSETDRLRQTLFNEIDRLRRQYKNDAKSEVRRDSNVDLDEQQHRDDRVKPPSVSPGVVRGSVDSSTRNTLTANQGNSFSKRDDAAGSGLRGAGAKVKPGPRRDPDKARRVLDIVKQVAGEADWKGKLTEVCEALDSAKIPFPKTWRRRDPVLHSWAYAADSEPALAKHAIEYQVRIAGN